MSKAVAPGEVLRGIQVEVQPLHVGRVRRPDEARGAVRPEATSVRDYEAELSMLRLEAQRMGYEDGVREGLAEAAAEMAAATEKAVTQALVRLDEQQVRLAALEASLTAVRVDCLAAAEDDMVTLCYETVCRIVAGCQLRPDTVRAQLQGLVLAHADAQPIVVHVHPQDAEMLQCRGGPGEEAGTGLRWRADPEVALGGCILHCEAGGIDARLETALAACKEALLCARAGRASAERLS